MNNGISLWATAASKHLSNSAEDPLFTRQIASFSYEVKLLGDSLWVIAAFGKNNQMAFRTAYSPDGFSGFKVVDQSDDALAIDLMSAVGTHHVDISFINQEQPILHYCTTLKPLRDLSVPFWPRDIIIYGQDEPVGETHISQTGTRSGLLYGAFKKPRNGAFLYLQNLTALSEYNNDTETSIADVVGGLWPELGLSLPPTSEKPMQQGKTYTVSDAYIAFADKAPGDQFEIAKGFLEALGNIYLLLPRPEVEYQDYLEVLPKALYDLENNKGCWSHRSGHAYLNAYLCDYQTPPEIMVQLAVLLPLQDYIRWSGDTCTMEDEIRGGLAAFYDEQIGSIMRWLPAEEDRLDESEEQKTPKVMDAWYLHHPLLNLARMASLGDKLAKELLLKSVDYAIKVAHHFNYVWPVFYKMDTLEVIKPETKPGKGGEKDVAGFYAHVMLQVWELTKEKKYFEEAERAAQSMVQHGFEVLYQANNTMFAAKAMILLYKETKKELYRDLSYLFIANIFTNVALYECDYGYGKYFPTFFELFPLSDAPYTAVYEEQEAYAGVHEFLTYAKGVELIPSVRLLLAEFVRFAVQRMVYYYPTMLPKEMLVEDVKTGELDPNLWIALEDIHDGWEKSGSVGQEVYGAGLAFGIIPRQYFKIPDEDFMVFIDYPVTDHKIKGKTMSFKVSGDGRLTCRLKFIRQGRKRIPALTIKAGNKADQQQIDALKQKGEEFECTIHGDQLISISWG